MSKNEIRDKEKFDPLGKTWVNFLGIVHILTTFSRRCLNCFLHLRSSFYAVRFQERKCHPMLPFSFIKLPYLQV